MQTQLVAIIYVSIALCLAYILTRTATMQPWYRSGMILWFVSVLLIFLLPSSMGLSLMLLAFLLIILTPRSVEQRIPFCLLTFCAVPTFVNSPIPFPFINYLISVNFQILIGMFVVIPALMGGRKFEGPSGKRISWGSICMFAYFAVTTLLMFRSLPLTATLRFGGEALLGTLLVYILILRFATSEAALEQALTAVYVAAVVLACIALLSQIKNWNFYSLVDTGGGLYEVRYGTLRTGVTMVPVLFGFLESVGIVMLLRHREIVGQLPRMAWLCGLLLLIGTFVSQSRGAWLGGLVTVSTYFLLKSRLSSTSAVLVIAFSSLSLAFMSFSNGNFSTDLDPFGSFDYRKELYIASWDQFQSAPIIGTPDFLNSGRFNHLVTGVGIVDLVSVYLGVVLQFGLVGLLLYIAPFLIALGGILRLRDRNAGLSIQSRTLIATLGAFIIGYLTMIFTVSGVSLILHFGVIFVALANAAVVCIDLNLTDQRKRRQLSSSVKLP